MALECADPGHGLTHDLGLSRTRSPPWRGSGRTASNPTTRPCHASGAGGGFNFRQNNELGHWPGGAWWWSSGLTVPADQWSHVAMTVAPDGVRVYLDGVEAHHAFSAEPGVQDVQFLGSYRGWGSRNMTGALDEVKIWNRTLTREEIREQRHLTLPQSVVEADPDLVAYYQFNEDTHFLVNKRGNHNTAPSVAARPWRVPRPVGSGVLTA